jgi:hypothetical protein
MKNHWLPFIGLWFLLIIALAFLTFARAFAHDKSHPITPEQKSWFNTLKSGRGPCCADADGNVLQDNDWDSKDGHYRVFIQGEWTVVPDDAVVQQPNLYGPTMVWGYPVWNGMGGGKMRFQIHCFMPGMMT